MTIDLTTARNYLKADGDDDDIITSLMAGAQGICQGYCNRRFYDTQDAADSDFEAAIADRVSATAALKTQLAAIPGNDADSMGTRDLISDHYIEVFGRISQRMNGIVIDDAIDAAILLTLGHLYANREDNIVSGNNAVQLPVGAQRILKPYLWIGNIGGDAVCSYSGYCVSADGS